MKNEKNACPEIMNENLSVTAGELEK